MKHGTRAEFALAIRILREADLQDGALDIEVHAMARRLEDIVGLLSADGTPILHDLSPADEMAAIDAAEADAAGSEDAIVFVE